MYQLWLDDLYPRAKFNDALTMVEKAGHTKRMQMARKDWINEGRRGSRVPENEDSNEDDFRIEGVQADQTVDRMEGLECDQTQNEPEPIAETIERLDQEDPDEDELDALLAESAQAQPTVPRKAPPQAAAHEEDPFADEMEAMADMDW